VSRHRRNGGGTVRWKLAVTATGLVLTVAAWALLATGGAPTSVRGQAAAAAPAAPPPSADAPPSPSPRPPSASPARSSAAPGGQARNFYVTFYGAADNTPRGSRTIAYPTVHREAGGTGTYRDPTTFATDRTELPVGTRIYVAPLRRYFVMEDDCTECDADWQGHGPNGGPRFPHVDLWAGAATDKGIVRCENSLTRDGLSAVLVNPPPNLPVSPGPLYDNGRCAGT
jgi:hypothetical protein